MAAKVAAKKVSKAKAYDSIEEELLDVTGEKPQGKKESREDFLTRVANAVDGLEEDDYDKLSEAATAWFEAAAKAVSKEKAPAEFPDAEATEEEETEEEATEEEEEEEEPVSARKKARGKAAKAPAKKAAKKTKAERGAPQGDGYKGHRAGTMKEKAHKLFDELTKAKKERGVIIKAIYKLGTAESTAKSWYGSFQSQ